ncbi:MAG TPA: 2-C-methyl-D-erythritol 4-phosphate cytidylyltransferase [Paludibacter sp.]|nr:2-C-methyl-D-erythritol 4-phosphate cytidylyltransferase [Paludibacter sp.]
MPIAKVALIVAGGKGLRMNAQIPKQFIEIQGKPILMHTLLAFHRYDPDMKLVLVLPASQIGYWQKLCDIYHFDIIHKIVAGGETRFESVKNGLRAVSEPSLVAVHDGVRPLASSGTIARCFGKAAETGAAIPVTEPVDSLRQISAGGSHSVDRDLYRLVQTPQVFDATLLKKAYGQPYSPLFTDDASVVEALGTSIHLVDGNRENIKITTEPDLKLASIFLENIE